MLSIHNKEDRIMIDPKDILTLLSIPCEEVSNVEIISDTKEITFIDIELKDNRPNCPFCFQNNIVIKDYYKVKIKNSIIRKHKLYVEIRIRRYKCKCCNKTFKQDFNFYQDNDLRKSKDMFMKQFFRCCNELCLSPQARAKISINAIPKKEDKKTLADILGDDEDD